MPARWRVLGALTIVTSTLVSGRSVDPAAAAGNPWDEPITTLSLGMPAPERASISADGRYAVVTLDSGTVWFYDRSTGGGFPMPTTISQQQTIAIVPDGSAVIFTSANGDDLVEPNPPVGMQIYKVYRGSPYTELLTGDIDPALRRTFDDSNADGTKLAIELTLLGGGGMVVTSRVAVLDTEDETLEYVDDIIPIADLRTRDASISSNGRYIAFQGSVGDCLPPCMHRAYVVDRNTDTYEAIDVGIGGADPNAGSYSPELSADGRHVSFYSSATNIVAGLVTAKTRLYVRDLDTDTTEFIAEVPYANAMPGMISADGQRLVYRADAPALGWFGPLPQIFVYDRATDTSHQITEGMNGELPNHAASWSKISEDGRTVVFFSHASNLIEGDYDYSLGHIFGRGPEIPPPELPPSFGPLVPARLLDSRLGATTTDGLYAGIGIRPAGSVTELQVSGRGGVPFDAGAAVLNVTAVETKGGGYLTVFPCDESPPNASHVNFSQGDTVANAVIAKLDIGGKICVYTSTAAHLIVDLNGYFRVSSLFGPLTPRRYFDSRPPPATTADGLYAGIGLHANAGSVTWVRIAGRIDVPAAMAVAMNVTVVQPLGDGYLTVFPCDEEMPTASSANYKAGETVPNAVIAKLDPFGMVCIYTYAEIDLVIDVNGYFPIISSFGPLVPARLLDSRPGATTIDGELAGIGMREAVSVTQIQVAGRGDVPPDASAVVLNVTAADAQADGYLTVFPCDEPQPLASHVNYRAGAVVPNAAISKLAADGTVCIYTYAATHILVDVNGYFPADT